jgi:hypothetical protein
MKVVYLLTSSRVSLVLENMILPQLAEERHGAEVVGTFFFDENVYLLLPENPVGEKLTRLASKLGFFVMACDFCCSMRGISGRLYPTVTEGCFPDLYRLAAERGAEQVITL